MDINRIRKKAKEMGLTLDDIATRANISREGFSKMLGKGDMKVSVLESISETLGVSPCYFFETSHTGEAPGTGTNELQALRAELKEEMQQNFKQLLTIIKVMHDDPGIEGMNKMFEQVQKNLE